MPGADRQVQSPGRALADHDPKEIRVTAIPALLSRADRKRLLKRLDELGELDALIRERGTLARPAATRPSARTGGTAGLHSLASVPARR
jgi:hypothetical protein